MGGKSQGSARTPHEAPDSLRSSQRLRAIGLISLGPIKGPANNGNRLTLTIRQSKMQTVLMIMMSQVSISKTQR